MTEKLILPGGRPVVPRKKVIHHPNVALQFETQTDGAATIRLGDQAIYELDAGAWRVVTAEAWDRLLRLAMEARDNELPEVPPIPANSGRKLRRKN